MQSIYLIGDSIAVHYEPFLTQYTKNVFRCVHRQGEAEALNNLDLPMGANAGDSGMVLEFLRGKRARGGIDADLILLNCGLHDIRTDPATGQKKTPLEVYRANLEAIVDEISVLRPRLLWVRTTPCDEKIHNTRIKEFYRFGEDVTTYNFTADTVMKKRGISVIDLHQFTKNLDAGPSLFSDHIHFPVHIREKQAAFIAGYLLGIYPEK
jgi:hypothetical protein